MELERGALEPVWWHMPSITALRELRQEYHKFEANLSCLMKPCHGTKKKKIQYLRSKGKTIKRSRSPSALSEFEATMGYMRPTT